MSGSPVGDRRAERNARMRREILDAAWELARTEGLGALAMRDLGARVGMRAQSLYSYFPSKHAIFDAMFADANQELLRWSDDLEQVEDPVEALRRHARMWVGFAIEDPVRYQLLYQRTIPRFEPSTESYGLARQFFANKRGELKLQAFDVLKQNRSVVRNTSDTYVEDVRSRVLQQYFLLSFTYNLRQFGK